jgi:GT2 family glycosyltransferase
MKVSIVIPTYNGQKLLRRNLPLVTQALKTWTKKSGNSGEIIVVDDASTDGTANWLADKYPKVRLVSNQRNLQFARSCNRGVDHATGKLIVLLNNDVEPETRFLAPLISHFQDKQVFAVGCREANVQRGRKVIGGRGMSAFRRGLIVHWRPKNQQNQSVSWVSAGSAAYQRDIWQKLGGFDPLFRPAYEEDRDLSWQALKAGYQLVFEPKSVVFHRHQTTSLSIFGTKKIEQYSLKNQLLLVWKNISSPRFLLQHLLWLPYHLTITTVRTKGVFLLAFGLALAQLPEALSSRIQASRHWTRSDEEVFGLE